jgi:hypothetical protein
MNRLWLVLLPELRKFPEVKQDKALQNARDCELESLELVGIAVWLVLVTSLTKYLLTKASLSSDPSATLAVNIVVDVPLLAVVFVPIHIRRLRRGLRKQLDQQGRL